jgi:hypothetical protein
MTDLFDYVKPGRRAIVGKVHGSVHWGTPVGDSSPPQAAEALLSLYCGYDPLGPCSEVILAVSDMATFNWRYSGRLLYPVLTAPLAGKSQLACPKGHLEALSKFVTGSFVRMSGPPSWSIM